MARDKNNRTIDAASDGRPDETGSPVSATEPGSISTEASALRAGTSEWTASDEREGLQTAPEAVDPVTATANVPTTGPTSEQRAADRAADTTEPAGEFGSAAASPSSAVPVTEAESAPRRSLWPVAAGVVVGAIIGAGSAAAVYETHNADTGLSQKVASLSSRVDTLGQRPDPAQALSGLKSSVKDLDGKVTDAQKSAASAQQTARKAEQDASQAAAKAARPGFDPASLQQKIAALQTGLDALRKQTTGAKDLDAKVSSLTSAVDGLRKQDSGSSSKIADLQSSVADLKKQDGEQSGKITSVQSSLADVKKQSDAQQGKLGGIAANAGGLKSLDTKVSAIKTTVDGIQKQATTTQATIAALQSQQKGLEGRVTVSARAVAADDLVRQVGMGHHFATQTDELASLGADPARIAVLRQNASQGVPSARSLAESFKKLADSMVAVEYKASKGSSFMDRLKTGMSSLVSVRGTNETGGGDLASHVTLIQAKLRHGDVIGAYSTWDTLPAEAKAKSKAWGAQAKTSAEAMTAALGLREQAISTLGGKKS